MYLITAWELPIFRRASTQLSCIVYDLHGAASVSNCAVSTGTAGMCSDVANRRVWAGIKWRQFCDWSLGIMCALLMVTLQVTCFYIKMPRGWLCGLKTV